MIEDQREKQIKAFGKNGKQLVRSNDFAAKEEKSITLDKQKEIFHNLAPERTGEIEKITY